MKSMETIFETLTKHAQSLMEPQSNGQDAISTLRKTSKELDITLANCNELQNKALEQKARRIRDRMDSPQHAKEKFKKVPKKERLILDWK